MALLAYSGAGAPSALTSRAEGTTATRTHAAPRAAVAQQRVHRAPLLRRQGRERPHLDAVARRSCSAPTTTGSGSGFLTVSLGEQTGVAAGTVAALSATSGISSAKAIAWTLVLPPA